MPGYKGHLVGGAIAYGVVLYTVYSLQIVQPSLLTAAEWLGFTLAGALFPDVDTKSKGQKFFYLILLALFIVLLTTNHTELIAALAILALIPLIVRHRGIFHRAWFVILFPLTVAVLCGVYGGLHCSMLAYDTFFFIVGALSHLILDLGVRRTFKW